MTENEFFDFVDKNNLGTFDELLEIDLKGLKKKLSISGFVASQN